LGENREVPGNCCQDVKLAIIELDKRRNFTKSRMSLRQQLSWTTK